MIFDNLLITFQLLCTSAKYIFSIALSASARYCSVSVYFQDIANVIATSNTAQYRCISCVSYLVVNMSMVTRDDGWVRAMRRLMFACAKLFTLLYLWMNLISQQRVHRHHFLKQSLLLYSYFDKASCYYEFLNCWSYFEKRVYLLVLYDIIWYCWYVLML